MKHYLTLIFLFILIKPVLSQQDPQYSQYMFNTLVINPAYAGYRETNNISLLHRDQWSGFAGAPKTQSLIADGAFGIEKKVGLGFSLVSDKAGLQRQTIYIIVKWCVTYIRPHLSMAGINVPVEPGHRKPPHFLFPAPQE